MSRRRLSFALGHRVLPDDLLTLRLRDSGPIAVIEVDGELDMSSSHLLTDFAEAVLRAEPLVLILNLAKLRFLCADGLRALGHVRDTATAQATHVIIGDPSPAVVRVLAITGLLDAFEIKTSHPRPPQP